MKCGECIYWTPMQGSPTVGQCRRYPPTPVPRLVKLPEEGYSSEFRYHKPMTTADDWCGEYKPS
jgi:hypothetical protein